MAFLALASSIQPIEAAQLFSTKSRAEGDAVYKSAFAAYDAGDLVRANDLLDQAEKLKPDQADGWNLRGAVYLKQGAYAKAEAAFSRAVALDPNLWAAQFNYAEVAFRSKNYPLARARFDRLGTQTDRFKQKNQWELVQYKAFIASLMANDEPGAQKRLAKLPATGGATPAYAYAQAALAYRHKDALGAEKSLSGAQTAYNATLNNLFSESLEAVGWRSANLLPAATLASATPLPASNGPAGLSRPTYVIDPKLEAAAADPLPAPDSATVPVNAAHRMIPVTNASPSDALLLAPVTIKPLATPMPRVDSALERGTLLD